MGSVERKGRGETGKEEQVLRKREIRKRRGEIGKKERVVRLEKVERRGGG